MICIFNFSQLLNIFIIISMFEISFHNLLLLCIDFDIKREFIQSALIFTQLWL